MSARSQRKDLGLGKRIMRNEEYQGRKGTRRCKMINLECLRGMSFKSFWREVAMEFVKIPTQDTLL